jgi:nucleoside-diphosphate-sugar epimerase
MTPVLEGKVALFGAAGAVGRALAPELESRRIAYRVVGRDAEKLRRAFPKAETVQADFLAGDGVDVAAAGIDTVFYLVGAPYTHFEQHPVMTRNALAAAHRNGVKRFVHIAPVYSYGPALTRPVPESQPHHPNTRKGRWRLEQEQAVLAEHSDAMRTVIVHLPDFYGPFADSSFANYFMNEAVAGKPATFIGPLDAQREFIFVPDAAAPLVELAALDDAYGRCWNLGAVSPITGRDFSNLVYAALGTKPRPRAVSKFMLSLFGLFNPFMREIAEMYYLYDSVFILDDSQLRARLGGFNKTPYSEGIRRTIDWIKSTKA